MNKKFFADIRNIRAAIDANKLVVFAGAGISKDAGIPTWDTLINEMKSEINIPDKENDFLRIAQMYFNERQQKEFIDKVRTTLKHKKIKYNEIHEEIFNLKPEHILTTNYDDLLEQVIKKKSSTFSVVSKDQEFPYALNTSLLVKVHGDLNNTDIVLKEDDYIDYSINHPLIEAFIKSIFASKVVLFIGYSFSDINLKMIIQTVRNILGKDFQNAYLLSIDKSMHPSQKDYLKNKGINVVNYFDVDNADGNYIKQYLTGNNSLNEIHYKEGKNLTEEGQNLFNFLNFISNYDKFNEPLNGKNLIDQIYLSLMRFSEFKSLPPDFVANLYPFNISKNHVNNYSNYSLVTKNSKIYDLFFDQIEYENGEIKFKPSIDVNLPDEDRQGFEKKLRDIIYKLNFSLIFYLQKEITNPDSLGNYGRSDEFKKIEIKINTLCNCLTCRTNRFEFGDVVKEIINSNVHETSSIHYGLELAYFNYKVGNFYHSFNLFKEVANQAWQEGKYFSYYIALNNIKNIRNFIRWYERSLKEEEKKLILKEMDSIDVDKLIFQIPFMGEAQYELLKTIRDNEVLKSSEREIAKTYKKILEAYDLYNNGGTLMGSYYPKNIDIELNKIISFYTNNHIIADEFSDFKKVCQNGIEALLISYATSDNYPSKLPKFNELFFKVVVFYGDSKRIKETTEKYSINKIEFEEESLPKIFELINNFLKSFFKVSTYLTSISEANIAAKNQLNNDFFADKARKTFSNIFILLSGLEINKDLSKDLISNLIEFIKHESFLHRTEIQYLSSFIWKNYTLFTQKDLLDILNSIVNKLPKYSDEDFFNSIAYVFKNNNFSGISDKDLIFKILSQSSSLHNKNDMLIPLSIIFDIEIKEELKQKIYDALNKKFDADLYVNASFENVIDYNVHLEQYIKEINSLKDKSNGNLSDDDTTIQNYHFINAMLFIYKMKIESDDKRLESFTNLADYMEFYLFPEKFDYKKFKIEWLNIIGSRIVFHERFNKIVEIKKAIEEELKRAFNKKLAKVYSKYYL